MKALVGILLERSSKDERVRSVRCLSTARFFWEWRNRKGTEGDVVLRMDLYFRICTK